EVPGVIGDPVFQADYMYQVYTAVKPDYTGRVTVPVLFDKKTKTIVSNESSEIIRMLNSAFDGIGAKEGDYVPAEHLQEIDEVNDFVYHRVNNGVYKSGFATKQDVYEE
ncbi:glutathione S-transferase family protein, partial [Streptococcus pyogenes]